LIDIGYLRESGLSDSNLKLWLGGDPKLWPSVPVASGEEKNDADKRVALHNRIRSRTDEGRQRNFSDWRVFAAIDKSWSQALYQISPSILASFIDTDPNSEDVLKQLDGWGLAHLITETVDAKSGKAVKKLNLPVFFKVFVPLVKAYVTIRWAKIMNDRRQTPFFKYEPFKQTTPMRLKCEALTDRINVISNQYGYYDVMKQAVLKMLNYSYALQFITKEWDYEEQWRKATAEDVALGKTKAAPSDADPNARLPVNEGEYIKVTDREGLSYHTPHPSRSFWDMAHGKHTINYDHGCQFTGYWRIARYRELKESNFWNTEAIALGGTDLIGAHKAFFDNVYPCMMKYGCASATAASAEIGVGAPPLDREKEIANQYYGTELLDQGVLVTEYFEKLVPKDNGLGTYDCPVWFRFVLAGDGCTILYAAPLPYAPTIYYGYDADESLSKNSSLAQEVQPFQDHFGNVLTQILHTAKQNLANLTLIDEDQLTENAFKKIGNIGDDIYQGLNLFGFSGKKAFRGQNRVVDAIHSFNLPKGNVAELTNVLKTILDVLERILVMSSQEIAQAASHEQTREEVRVISASMTSRLQFTSTPVDIATAAWKRQLYQAVMAYGDDDMWAHLPSDIPLSKEALEAFGFTYVDKDAVVGRDRYRAVKFNKKSTAVDMWLFANTRDDTDRGSDKDAAVAWSQIVQNLMNNPISAQAIGADQMIEIANLIGHLSGAFPRDWNLKNAAPNVSEEQRQQQAQEQLKAVTDQVLSQVHSDMQHAIEPLLEATKKNSDELGIVMPAVGQLMTMLRGGAPPPMAGGPPMPPQLPPNGQPMVDPRMVGMPMQ